MKTKIWLALLALYIVWGSTYLGIKVAIETIPPFLQAGIRFFISGVILLVWQRAAGSEMPTRRQWASTAIIGILLLLGGNGLLSWAEQVIPSGIAAVLIGSIPIFLVIAEALRPNGIKPTWRAVIGLMIGFAGIFLLAGPSGISGSGLELDPWGVAALLTACVLWAAGSIYSKTADLPKSSLMTTGSEMLMGSLGLFVVSFLAGEWHGWDLMEVSSRSLMGMAYLITVGSLVGFGSYIWLLQNAPISLVATYAYVNPVVAVLLGYWLGGEPLEPRTWLAAAIIIGSVILINSSKKVIRRETQQVLEQT
jgi:drug/metabolite transporter (DMT)-like permease